MFLKPRPQSLGESLQRAGRRSRAQFEREALRGRREAPFGEGRTELDAPGFGRRLVDVWYTAAAFLAGAWRFITAPKNRRPIAAYSTAWRRILLGAGTALAATMAAASALVVKGYNDHPPEFWQARFAERRVSPILDRHDTLVGMLDTQGAMPADLAVEFAYVPLAGEVPETFKQGLLFLENRHLYRGGIYNVCGIDLTAAARVLAGKGGGSGLAQQLAFALKQPDWVRGRTVDKLIRALQQVGAACRLYGTLGGPDALMRAYAEYAPMLRGRGTLHGLESASRVMWDLPPQALKPALQLVLAAAVKSPLTVVPEASRAIPCVALLRARGNPVFDETLYRAHRERAGQCQVLRRARYAAGAVLESSLRETVLEELWRFEVDGLVPINPFEPIDPARLVNLSSRTVSLMQEGLLQQLRREARRGGHVPGQPLVLSLDSVQQHDFAVDMTTALDRIQRSPIGRGTLCLPLTAASPRPAMRRCGVAGDSIANVLAAKVDLRTGSFQALYASGPGLLQQRVSGGSLDKLVVLAAAVADGYAAQSLVCPKKAWDGKRPLKRVAAPVHGFDDCPPGRNALTLLEATATSDNLAYYQLAQALGDAKLRRAAQDLGLEAGDEPNLPYSLAFGTFGVKPAALLRAGQRLFGAAYGLPLSSPAPSLLMQQTGHTEEPGLPLARLLPTREQRDTLRALLEAPVRHPRGTLAFARGHISAGKTGTVQSAVHDATGNNYAHGKFALTYSQDRGTVDLWMVASPLPSVPLAYHDVRGSLFAPAHALLTESSKD